MWSSVISVWFSEACMISTCFHFRFHNSWLRFCCQCAQCKQAHSGQKTFDVLSIPDPLELSDFSVSSKWSMQKCDCVQMSNLCYNIYYQTSFSLSLHVHVFVLWWISLQFIWLTQDDSQRNCILSTKMTCALNNNLYQWEYMLHMYTLYLGWFQLKFYSKIKLLSWY